MYARRRIVNLKKTQRVTEACANSPPRIRRIPHRESADFLTANSPTSPPRIPYREFADLSLSLANIDQWIRGESMANVRPIICVIGEYHSSRIRRIKFVWIRGEYSPCKFQMNSTVWINFFFEIFCWNLLTWKLKFITLISNINKVPRGICDILFFE